MKSKITELGVFAVGLGVLLVGLFSWTAFVMTSNSFGGSVHGGGNFSPKGFLILIAPAVVMMLSGALVLALRSRPAVLIAMVVICLALALDVVVALAGGGIPIIKIVINFLCVGLVIKTGRQAMEEAEEPATPVVARKAPVH